MNSMIEELRKISLENELWLKYKICGKIFYFISNKGRFASIIGINPNRSKGRCWKVKLITPYSNGKGYMIVRTRENNKTNYHQVHRMVKLITLMEISLTIIFLTWNGVHVKKTFNMLYNTNL